VVLRGKKGCTSCENFAQDQGLLRSLYWKFGKKDRPSSLTLKEFLWNTQSRAKNQNVEPVGEPSTAKSEITVLELRRLLHQIKDLRPDLCVRFRLMGELWQKNPLRIIKLTEIGVIVNDETGNKLIIIPDLKMVMQIELDFKFQQYQPNFHYSITLERTEGAK